MELNIDLNGLKRHFFPQNGNKVNEKVNSLVTTKIVKQDFYSINELQICEKIKKIPYYIANYHIVDSYEYISISQLNDKYIDKVVKTRYLNICYKNKEFIEIGSFAGDEMYAEYGGCAAAGVVVVIGYIMGLLMFMSYVNPQQVFGQEPDAVITKMLLRKADVKCPRCRRGFNKHSVVENVGGNVQHIWC